MPRISSEVIKKVASARVGFDVLPLIEALKSHNEVSEFELAKLLHEDINSVRNKLYRLQQQNLLQFKKKKDEKKGWYVYFWSLRAERFKYLYKEILESELTRLDKRIKKEQESGSYECPNQCVALGLEEALGTNYQCPDCGATLNSCDNSKLVAKMKKRKSSVTQSIRKCS